MHSFTQNETYLLMKLKVDFPFLLELYPVENNECKHFGLIGLLTFFWHGLHKPVEFKLKPMIYADSLSSEVTLLTK
jgi:hypothetical protein